MSINERTAIFKLVGDDIYKSITIDGESATTALNEFTGRETIFYRGRLHDKPIIVTEEFYKDFLQKKIEVVHVSAREEIVIMGKTAGVLHFTVVTDYTEHKNT
jgi:hypothetical protein